MPGCGDAAHGRPFRSHATGARRGSRRSHPAPVRGGDQRGICRDARAHDLGAERRAAGPGRAQSNPHPRDRAAGGNSGLGRSAAGDDRQAAVRILPVSHQPRAGLHLHVSADGIGSSRMPAVDAVGHFRPLRALGCFGDAGTDRELRSRARGRGARHGGADLEYLCRRLRGPAADSARACDHARLGRLFRPARAHRERPRLRASAHDMRVRVDRARELLDRRHPPEKNGTGYRMGRRMLLILGALVAATIYFRLRPGA